MPKLIDDIVKAGGKGVANGHGFYKYTPEESKMWEETFADFNYEIRNLAMKYPFDIVKRKLAKLKEEKEGKDS
jgi:3-hydroxybutyryl-CoA dehydrogenase